MIDDEVVADGPGDATDALITAELYSVDNTLAGESGEQSVRECGLVVRHPTVYDLRPADFPELSRRRDAHALQFLLVHFRFDLEELPRRRRYLRARFTVVLGDSDCLAVALHPPLITTATEVERSRSFTLGPTLAFEGVGELSLSEVGFGRKFTYTELHPAITPHGDGHSTFSWTYTAQDGGGLIPCSRATFAVLQLPRGRTELDFSFRGDATVHRRIVGIPRSIPTEGEPRHARLNVRNGMFTAL